MKLPPDAAAGAPNDGKSAAEEDDGEQPARADVQRPRVDRRILDEIFGDVLPDTTGDERDPGSASSGGYSEQWYRDNRPPHHGG